MNSIEGEVIFMGNCGRF